MRKTREIVRSVPSGRQIPHAGSASSRTRNRNHHDAFRATSSEGKQTNLTDACIT